MKFPKFRMWIYVHSSAIAMTECLLALLCIFLSVGLSRVLNFRSASLIIVSLMWILFFVVVVFFLMYITVMLIPRQRELLDKVSHFDEGVSYDDIAVGDHQISVLDGDNIRSLSPRNLYAHEVELGGVYKPKVIVYTRVLNEDATPLEQKFFEKLRNEIARTSGYNDCKYGRIVEFKH